MGLQKKTIDALGGLASTRMSIDDLTLEVIDGPHQGLSLRLDKEVTRIGREDWCDISLPDDPWISNVHCECVFAEQGLRVHDLDSRNGITLGNIRVVDAYFHPGIPLQVGQSVLQLRSHNQNQELAIPFHDNTGTLVGKSLAMRKMFNILPRLAKRKVTTLLTGETGTGKTSIAHAIHLHHQRDDAPFVVVNCGALPHSLITAALFGHEKGAFTGADKRHIGFFEQANGGTLFLDEIAELPLDLQPKLLDVLERRVIRRLGSEKEHPVAFHLLTATHTDLKKQCSLGRFREDLFFRLSVMELKVPALRERIEDLPLLIEAFLKELNPEHTLYVSSEGQAALQEHLWPGNIRELRNMLERAMIFLDDDTITLDHLEFSSSPTNARQMQPTGAFQPGQGGLWLEEFPTLPLSGHEPLIPLKDLLKIAERFIIIQALDEKDFNVIEAAQLLGLSESWLYSRIKLYDLASRRKG